MSEAQDAGARNELIRERREKRRDADRRSRSRHGRGEVSQLGFRQPPPSAREKSQHVTHVQTSVVRIGALETGEDDREQRRQVRGGSETADVVAEIDELADDPQLIQQALHEQAVLRGRVVNDERHEPGLEPLAEACQITRHEVASFASGEARKRLNLPRPCRQQAQLRCAGAGDDHGDSRGPVARQPLELRGSILVQLIESIDDE